MPYPAIRFPAGYIEFVCNTKITSLGHTSIVISIGPSAVVMIAVPSIRDSLTSSLGIYLQSVLGFIKWNDCTFFDELFHNLLDTDVNIVIIF